MVPKIRIRAANDHQVNAGGTHVLYWMTAFRRTRWNFSLQRAVEWTEELGKPLVILEALRCDYPWASERLHQFILQGMSQNRKALAERPVTYVPFVETEKGQGRGLLESLAKEACVVVTDEFPAFFLPRMVTAAAKKLGVKLELVDSNGLLPIRASDRVFPTAFSFRSFLQKSLPRHLESFPHEDPLSRRDLRHPASIPLNIERQWPIATEDTLRADPRLLKEIPIDHSTAAVDTPGGTEAAEVALRSFLRRKLDAYHTDRNHPDEDATSGLSPYLHFGHIAVHQVFSELMEREDWSLERLGHGSRGQREGWWGMTQGAESFLDELVTWRELGFNFCSMREDYDRFSSLPPWAMEDLLIHAKDPRPYIYSLEEFETARTHDPLWNAAQKQLLGEGRIHNYLRMLWGKKILHWSPSPQEALDIMIQLNNKYALDGRDPNSYTGIFWVLGRYDRPWGPIRPVFGKIRYMSSRNTLRKVKVSEYLDRYK